MYMKLFGKFREKDKSEVKNSSFTKHGFIKLKDRKKKLHVTVNEVENQFDFETNMIYEIPLKLIKFALCIHSGKKLLFINKDYIPLEGTTSPYRTFYSGLMKEPFKFCYPFDEQVTIETKERDRLEFLVMGKQGAGEREII